MLFIPTRLKFTFLSLSVCFSGVGQNGCFHFFCVDKTVPLILFNKHKWTNNQMQKHFWPRGRPHFYTVHAKRFADHVSVVGHERNSYFEEYITIIIE